MPLMMAVFVFFFFFFLFSFFVYKESRHLSWEWSAVTKEMQLFKVLSLRNDV